jgi:aryl-alcohol dehydrogenase-like predicted oxidoreductase
MELRALGNSGLKVSAVSLGCWPMAGMCSPGTSEENSLATIRACRELGVNHLDTAYCYGMAGESERFVGQAIAGHRDEFVIATKGGIQWAPGRKQVLDASPSTLRSQCETSLRRLNVDHVDLLYLHSPDGRTPVAESAGELKRLMDEGKTRAVGVSNVTLAQLTEFAAACPLSAYQPPYNMLQRQIEADTLPWCRRNGVAVMVYWPLLKGLLAGRLPRDLTLAPTDSRRRYPMYQGDEWQKNVDFVERLRAIAQRAGHSVAELVINWTIHQPGITSALCGAKRPDQIRETAGGAGWQLTPGELADIEQSLVDRGPAAVKSPV